MWNNDIPGETVRKMGSEVEEMVAQLLSKRFALMKELEEVNGQLRRARVMISDGLGEQTKDSEPIERR